MDHEIEHIVIDPVVTMFIEGGTDEPSNHTAIFQLHGEDSNNTQLLFTSSEGLANFAELIIHATRDLRYAEENGMEKLVEMVGTMDETPLYLNDILGDEDD